MQLSVVSYLIIGNVDVLASISRVMPALAELTVFSC